MDSAVAEIVAAFGLPEGEPKKEPVARDFVMRWSASEDVETLGALYAFLSKAEHWCRVSPPLVRNEYYDFLMHYFGKCLLQNPDGQWAHGGFAAAWDIASWLSRDWKDRSIPRSEFARVKQWLETVYLKGDESTKKFIVQGALEHMFENRDLAKYFEDWARSSSSMSRAYAEAMGWSDRGGKSPLSR